MRRANGWLRGAAVAALVGAGGLVVLAVHGWVARGTSLTASFTDVRGLVPGAQVRLAGVPVGAVDRIWLGPDGWPRVRLTVRDGVAVRQGTHLAVRLASLSGEFNRYVSLVPGEGPPLPAGAVIPRADTVSPVEVDEALGAFDARTRADLRTVLGGLRGALAGRAGALTAGLRESQAALAQVGALSADAGADGAELGQALSGTQRLAATLAARTPALRAAVDESAGLLATVAGRAGSVSATVAGLPAALEAASGALGRAQALVEPADGLVRAAAPAVAELPATAREARAALGGAQPVLTQAARIAEAAPGAARAFSPVLGAAGPLLGVMTPVLAHLGPMLDQLRVRLPDAFSFFANWADFTSNYDANGHAARVGIVLPPAPDNALDPASNGPGQLKPPYLRIPGFAEGQPWSTYTKSFVAGGKGP